MGRPQSTKVHPFSSLILFFAFRPQKRLACEVKSDVSNAFAFYILGFSLNLMHVMPTVLSSHSMCGTVVLSLNLLSCRWMQSNWMISFCAESKLGFWGPWDLTQIDQNTTVQQFSGRWMIFQAVQGNASASQVNHAFFTHMSLFEDYIITRTFHTWV